jgi:two-component system, OmpR family, response regulator VanR
MGLKMLERELILIIEDEAEIRNLLVEMVYSLGFKAYHCSNGREALDLLIEKKVKPVLVLCDMNMPEMTGIEFVQYQLAKNLNLNVCMLTADVSQNRIIQSLQLGVTDYICKPPNYIELSDKITRLAEFGRNKYKLQSEQVTVPDKAHALRENSLFRWVNSAKKEAA